MVIYNDNRFYVYGHFNNLGNLVYIGSGTKDRIVSKIDRSDRHLKLWDSLSKKIILDNLTMIEARNLEQSLIDEYSATNNLLNKNYKVSIPRDYDYRYFEEYLAYSEESPSGLIWLKKTTSSHRFNNENIAGTLNSRGYWSVGINRRYYSCHRIIYALYHKVTVPHNLVIDHIDRDKSNNIIGNLRLVTSSINSRNKGLRVDNKTSVNGVRWCKTLNKYYVIWVENLVAKSKSFNPSTLYPDIPIDVARDLTFKDAVQFREDINAAMNVAIDKEVKMIYNEVSQC